MYCISYGILLEAFFAWLGFICMHHQKNGKIDRDIIWEIGYIIPFPALARLLYYNLCVIVI